ncbi:hypothetical protein [Brevundimonas subvibrioides]|uniref:Uncharacterized protein n=1 Tax=Brevundimonas subvibrioides (strain ATCC 15264 / DSM 4735 / LMG 14903 / NBRC 16000 / CB 81) TaxID=633149 RepID=D9QI80_BRESC|nr:hypothetical protein [Brevundimonas subvibrioides]ADK99382.1 hypothetical protein Bresu_0068 [Brevundimonas subvibrioides ATCC 15264]
MKSFSAEALAALASGDVIVSGAVRFGLPTPALFWGGHGNQVLDGEVYVGLGDQGLIEAVGGTLGGQEQGITLTLSDVDPDVAARVDVPALRNVSVVIRRLIFNGSGSTLLHEGVWLRGRVDSATTEETPGGTSTLRLGIEGAARGLGRRSERMRSDADQRLILSTDGFFSRVAYAGEKTISWGGKPPARAATLMGGTYGSVRGGGAGGGYGGGFELTSGV